MQSQSLIHHLAVKDRYTVSLRRTKSSTGNLTFVFQSSTLVFAILIDVEKKPKKVLQRQESQSGWMSHPSILNPISTSPGSAVEQFHRS